MSYRENIERTRSRSYFRITMDIGMGIFYTVIGLLIFFVKSFGNLQIPVAIAYVLGAMMAVGGVYRFIRGVKAALPPKNNNDTSPME